jgi:hypothetical protein
MRRKTGECFTLLPFSIFALLFVLQRLNNHHLANMFAVGFRMADLE